MKATDSLLEDMVALKREPSSEDVITSFSVPKLMRLAESHIPVINNWWILSFGVLSTVYPTKNLHNLSLPSVSALVNPKCIGNSFGIKSRVEDSVKNYAVDIGPEECYEEAVFTVITLLSSMKKENPSVLQSRHRHFCALCFYKTVRKTLEFMLCKDATKSLRETDDSINEDLLYVTLEKTKFLEHSLYYSSNYIKIEDPESFKNINAVKTDSK